LCEENSFSRQSVSPAVEMKIVVGKLGIIMKKKKPFVKKGKTCPDKRKVRRGKV